MNTETYKTFYHYMRETKLTASEEDYLEAIFRLTLSNGYTTLKQVANLLHVCDSTASSMIKKLTKKDLLIHSSYKNISLSSTGYETANFLYKRHTILINFFTLLDLEDNILKTVEIIEHAFEPNVIEKLMKLTNLIEKDKVLVDKIKRYLKTE